MLACARFLEEDLSFGEKDVNGKGDGMRYGYTDSRGKHRLYRNITSEEYEQILTLYEAADGAYRWDDSLGEVIIEIAGAYFAGYKILDETAALIQNRAQLYMSEQKKWHNMTYH